VQFDHLVVVPCLYFSTLVTPSLANSFPSYQVVLGRCKPVLLEMLMDVPDNVWRAFCGLSFSLIVRV
jgi:hypothetical protein